MIGFLVICGLPRSGNRLVHDMLDHHGLERKRMRIVHYGRWRHWDYARRMAQENGGELRAITMLRDVGVNEQSLRAHGNTLHDDIRDDHAAHWRPTLAAAAGSLVLPVVYEALVLDPEAWGKRIVDFALCGPWQGWHVDIYDGNEKYHQASGLEAPPP